VRTSTIVMIGFAVLFGLLAVFVAQSWLNTQAELRMKSLETKATPVSTQTVVVAARSLGFGSDLSVPLTLKEVAWPEGSLPAGVFSKISDLAAGGKRVVLTPIELNEPILASKITGPGQRATLSALLHPGMKAVTVRVNDVDGVAGFALPGDRVDVALTRQTDKGAGSTDVVLKNIRVLAVDQMSDERTEKPVVARSVTLEVETVAAQKIALAASVGTLSLLLRMAGDANEDTTRRVTLTDLFGGATNVQDTHFATVGVIRASKRDDYSVPVEGAGKDAVAIVGQR
jgi:pilus assembly protein CpaB